MGRYRSPSPLHLLIDSTGIKVEGEGEWNARTTSEVCDVPILPNLLDKIPADRPIASVTADGAYNTHKRRDATAE